MLELANMQLPPATHLNPPRARPPARRIAQLKRGEALVMTGAQWQLCPTSPYHQHPMFAALANPAPIPPDGEG